MHHLNRMIFRVLATAAAVVLSACAPVLSSAPSQLDVRVGIIPGVTNAQILVPANDGDFAARGLNVSILPVTDTNLTMISVATGQFDIGGLAVGPATLNAFDHGARMKIIASVYGDPPGHGSLFPIVVRPALVDSGAVRTVADLRGKRFGLVGTGNGGDYLLAKALATANLTASDVDVVTLSSFQDIMAALTTGAIDAALINQPNGAQAVAQGIADILIDNYNPNSQGAVLVANTDFLEHHRQAVTNFLEVYVDAIRRLNDGQLKHDDQALAVIQKYTDILPEVIRLTPDVHWASDGRVNVDSLREQQAFLMSAGELDYSQPLDIEMLIDYGPLDAALKSLGG